MGGGIDLLLQLGDPFQKLCAFYTCIQAATRHTSVSASVAPSHTSLAIGAATVLLRSSSAKPPFSKSNVVVYCTLMRVWACVGVDERESILFNSLKTLFKSSFFSIHPYKPQHGGVEPHVARDRHSGGFFPKHLGETTALEVRRDSCEVAADRHTEGARLCPLELGGNKLPLREICIGKQFIQNLFLIWSDPLY